MMRQHEDSFCFCEQNDCRLPVSRETETLNPNDQLDVSNSSVTDQLRQKGLMKARYHVSKYPKKKTTSFLQGPLEVKVTERM
jgi:hypothetical protein